VLDLIRRGLTQLGGLVAKPWAFALVLTYGILWFLFAPDTFGWQGLATMAVWFMTLLIQRAEHRDTQATGETRRALARPEPREQRHDAH
jgi:hypothetical protein